jgi:hypothetical protein
MLYHRVCGGPEHNMYVQEGLTSITEYMGKTKVLKIMCLNKKIE